MELTEGSETSANYNLTPKKYPKEHILYNMLDVSNQTSEWVSHTWFAMVFTEPFYVWCHKPKVHGYNSLVVAMETKRQPHFTTLHESSTYL